MAIRNDKNPAAEPALVYGNVYDKYATRNPIERHLVNNFLSMVERFVEMAPIREIHEVGCGEGRLSSFFVRKGYRVRGSDASPEVIDIARREAARGGLEIPFKVASVYDLNPQEDAAELVLCCEVLEHLDDPQAALSRLAELASPYLVVSVPREPIWRLLNMARGKYWRALGNTPGHLQHWSGTGFRKLLDRYVEVIAIAHPLPWTVALCRTKRPGRVSTT